MKKTLLVMTMVIALSMSMVGAAIASSTMLANFTHDELGDNWEADRTFPTGGVVSVHAFGRTDVAEIGIDGAEQAVDTFHRYEGIKTVGAQDFGQAVQVDLYLDPDWKDKAVAAGLWVVGEVLDDDNEPVRDNIFPIIEFINFGDGTVGFETFGRGGWEASDVQFEYGTWVTLSITLDTTAGEYSYAVDGEEIRTTASDAQFIREVFLNQYNFGTDFTAHWHAGVEQIDARDQCKDGNWEAAGFRNQGQCLRFVNTGQDSR